MNSDFLNSFRQSAPYIHAHRQKTFVIYFSGEAILNTSIQNLIHDFALLNSLGIRLILVHGIRPQINHALQQQNISSRFHQQLRITDKDTLACVINAAGQTRIEIESLLSLGVTNSPMAGADIHVSSGNFITAQPQGIIDGIDYQFTGKVRRIDKTAIEQQLNLGQVLLISPLGYSPSGEIFNLSAEQLATEIAITLQAEKLILMTEQSCQTSNTQNLIAQMTTTEALNFIQHAQHLTLSTLNALQSAIKGCQAGVKRIHLLNHNIDGALLIELFSHDGIGTLISAEPFENLRPANLNDIQGILKLIKPLEAQGMLISRSQAQLELNIHDYSVIDRDGLIIGCTALHTIENTSSGLIACLAIHPDYRKSERGNQLLQHLYQRAQQQHLNQLFALSTQTMHWFKERGFSDCTVKQLPDSLQTQYNAARNPKVLTKIL